jgi:ELWxxDGT repeat protein
MGDVAVFVADDGLTGSELWRTDGTPEGTERVVDLFPGAESGVTAGFVSWGERALFVGDDGGGVPQLWVTDGTAAGTRPVTDDVDPFSSSLPYLFRATSGHAFFAKTTDEEGQELWAVPLDEEP